MAKLFWELAAIMTTIIGVFHLAGTLFTKGLHPKDPQLIADMQTAPLNLSNKLIIWKAWIGFNAAHSCGVIFIGVTNFYLASNYFELLKHDYMFAVLSVAARLFYLWIARTYWFKGVFRVLAVDLVLFLTGVTLMIFNK